MVDAGDIRFFSVVLFKISSLILALLLGFQLIRSQLPFAFDLTKVFSYEQFVFVYALLIVTLLAFIEGKTLQAREGKGVEGFSFSVIILYIISGFGAYFVGTIYLGYDFDNSVTNIWIGYYLLVGAIMIFINAREQIFKRVIA